MSRDLYAALSGASSTMRQLDVVSNNLANVSTTGFKGQRMAFTLDGVDTGHELSQSYASPTGTVTDLRDGALARTGRDLDVALSGRGFFVVQGPEGPLLTRDGHFQLDAEGRLLAGGEVVMGEGGAIEVPAGESITVTDDGKVVGSVSGELDTLKLAPVHVEPRSADARVHQGALEDSNVDPMGAMAELVQASRYFEVYQKAMHASDEMDAKLHRNGGS